ncbi:unnamed protein product [Linum tenue]|uniref:Uncharacterized protein n=1 Tax=Linum tenue TaxID=586396 RepID=A0AAV0PTG8_9ROSI|nr:unnamed protein product [Linum tenue]CAI0444866.1 unnamed protein product [Linum tenue]CAI0474213.1 unnamed protein product [Linum tenue]
MSLIMQKRNVAFLVLL